ncbi:MAG TPA: hypothetical protein VE078_09515 [Thermoanaerobaculia bacterium]|nr:hypothetical protein [Thermoanaerobaculia bacterium]
MADQQDPKPATVSFANDIAPVFHQFRGQMMWRFDLTSYDDVVANNQQILSRIQAKGMPPPPFQPLSDAQIKSFEAWIQQGFPP